MTPPFTERGNGPNKPALIGATVLIIGATVLIIGATVLVKIGATVLTP